MHSNVSIFICGQIPWKECRASLQTDIVFEKAWVQWDMLCFSNCNHGMWSCKKLQKAGECAVEEGSHITTYDGRTFTFHGDCYYVLSRVGLWVMPVFGKPASFTAKEQWPEMLQWSCGKYWSHSLQFLCSQDCEGSKFTVLGQLVPCGSQESDTCLKTVVLILNNDKSNVSVIHTRAQQCVHAVSDLVLRFGLVFITWTFRPNVLKSTVNMGLY